MIVVSPDQLRQAADSLRSGANRIQDSILAADGALRGVDWSGLARDQFTGEYDAARLETLGLCEGLGWIANALNEIAGSFQQADRVELDFGLAAGRGADGRASVAASTLLADPQHSASRRFDLRNGADSLPRLSLDGGPEAVIARSGR